MKTYEKPVVLANEELAEGVYAASGAGDCWTVDWATTQDWNGQAHVFEIKIVHTTAVQHISTATTVVYTFSNSVTKVEAEGAGNYDVSWSGNTATVVRNHHANGYGSGDVATYKLFVNAADEATSKAIAITSATISCAKAINVQGGGAEEL